MFQGLECSWQTALPGIYLCDNRDPINQGIFFLFRRSLSSVASSQNFQGGRRYFSRREITALVGGPRNMAVYRHILLIPPTAKVLPPKNENRLPPRHYRRIALPLKKYRHILVLPLPSQKY